MSLNGMALNSTPSLSASPRPRLAILDVGHGNSAVLVDDHGVVVIDAGPGSALLDFLTQEGISRIDVLLISHADKDHIEGVIGLLASEEVSIGRIRLNSDALKSSELWSDLLFDLDRRERLGKVDVDATLNASHSGMFDQGSVHIEILAPSFYIAARGPGSHDRQGRVLTSNSISAVIRLVKNGRALVLLPGDIDEAGLANLISACQDTETPMDATAPIVVFPHHGGRPGDADMASFAKKFCELVRPAVVIFSIGRGRYQTPQPDVVSAVREAVPNVRIACTQLSTHCAANAPSIEPQHLMPQFARGREERRCCAGTLIFDLTDSDNTLLPSNTEHQDFISLFAPTALCRRNDVI